jgi:hypothetical protein
MTKPRERAPRPISARPDPGVLDVGRVAPAEDETMISSSDLDDLGELDRTSRIGRTTAQVGVPTAIVVVASWLARLFGIDLDPGAGVDMPPEVVAAWVAVLTVGAAWAMNRRRS